MRYLENQPVADRPRILELIKADRVEMAIMAFFDFASQPLRISNRTLPFQDSSGNTWDAGGGLLVQIPVLGMGEGELAPFRMFRLGMPDEWIDSDNFAADLIQMVADRAEYVGRTSQILEQLFDPATGQPIGNPTVIETGTMDKMSVSFPLGGAIVSLTSEGLLARKGVPVYGVQTYRDQKRRYPTDEGLEFVTETNRLVTWTDF
jgi:hypothetical protein